MKKLVTLLMVVFMMCSALSASAATKQMTEEEAIVSIEKALTDPEIKEWVNDKYGSEKKFLRAVKFCSEDTIFEIASTFDDFQQNGGDLTFKDDELKLIIIGLGFLILLAIII